MFAVHLLSFYFSKLQEDQIKKVTVHKPLYLFKCVLDKLSIRIWYLQNNALYSLIKYRCIHSVMFCFVFFCADSKSLTLSVCCQMLPSVDDECDFTVPCGIINSSHTCLLWADNRQHERKDLDLLICIYWTDFHLHESSHLCEL